MIKLFTSIFGLMASSRASKDTRVAQPLITNMEQKAEILNLKADNETFRAALMRKEAQRILQVHAPCQACEERRILSALVEPAPAIAVTDEMVDPAKRAEMVARTRELFKVPTIGRAN